MRFPIRPIIEQTAQVFRDYLGVDNVLEHHSGFDFDADELGTGALQKRQNNGAASTCK